MQQRPFDPLIGVAVFGLCSLSFMLGAAFTGSLNWKFALEVTTAVGTVAAAVVAAWLGIATAQRARNEALDRASLVAARILPTIAPVISDLNVFFLLTPPASGADDLELAKKQTAFLLTMQDALNEALPHLDIDHASLLALTPLPKRAAARFARGFAIARSTRDFTSSRLRRHDDWYEREGKSRALDVAFALAGLREAVNLCEVAVNECTKLVDIAAQHPTYEEMYGETSKRQSQ